MKCWRRFWTYFCPLLIKNYKAQDILIHFRPMLAFSPFFHFYAPWKLQKLKVFLTFSGGIEREHWLEWVKNRKMCENSSKLTNKIRMSSVYIASFEQIKSRFIISPIFLVFRILRYRQKMLKRKYFIWKFICQGNFALKK